MPIFGQGGTGILGNYSQGGAGLGLLGGAQQTPDWAQKLGLFSAAIKDAANSFSGQGDTNSLQTWQQGQQGNQIRQHLMGALNSPDPTVRQQGYQALTMMGGDPSAFQKQQATQQLPQLLQSMRPSQQTLNSTSAPLPGGGNVTAAPINFEAPGLNISDAISQAPPELQGQYAPKLLEQQMTAEAEANKPFDLSPGQVRFAGGQQVASLPGKPITREYQNGGNKITEQSVDNGQTWTPLGKGPAWKPDDETPPDPSTVQYWAQSVAAGQPLPALGMGKQAAQYRQAILKGAAAINSGQGLTGVDQNVNIATTKANSGALGKQTALRSATEGFENTMLQNMNVARDLLKKGAGTTGIPVLNRYQQYIKGQYAGDPDVIALKNAIDTVADENAKIRSGTLGNTPATDAMRASIHEGLNTSQTPEQILSAFGVMEKDAGNRSRALRAQEAALKRGLTGKNDLPQIPGIREPQAQGASPPLTSPAALPRLPAAPKIRTFNPATGRLE